MTWVATVNRKDGTEIGCVWAADISAIYWGVDTLLVVCVQGEWHTVGKFDTGSLAEAKEAGEALALVVERERDGWTDEPEAPVVANEKVLLGPKSTRAVDLVRSAGSLSAETLVNVHGIPLAVLAKLVPRYLTYDPETVSYSLAVTETPA